MAISRAEYVKRQMSKVSVAHMTSEFRDWLLKQYLQSLSETTDNDNNPTEEVK